MKITIDAGHSGNYEPGACGGGMTEADIVLDIALELGRLLENEGHTVLQTRTGNIYNDGLAFRASLANMQPADLFVSIHCNSAENIAARGTEVFHYPNSLHGVVLADCIRKRIVSMLGTVDRGTKEANFQVLRETDAPAVLVETAFISNIHDRQYFASLAGRALFAHAIYFGIADFADI